MVDRYLKNKVNSKIKSNIHIFKQSEIFISEEESIKLPYLGNGKCHINSKSYWKANQDNVAAIWSCIQEFDNDMNFKYVIHFIVELKNGKFVDPTFGNLVEESNLKYYLLNKFNFYNSFYPTRDLNKEKEKFLKRRVLNNADIVLLNNFSSLDNII